MAGTRIATAGAALALGLLAAGAARAETVMQQCGQQYQTSKAAGTLNGMNWSQFRTECAARLKAQPASANEPAPANPAPGGVAPSGADNPLKPATTTVAAPASPVPSSPVPSSAAPAGVAPAGAGKAAAPVSAGRAAMLSRERQCGAEWRADKASLVAKTPGLTWPKYWHECNTRLKAARAPNPG